MRYRRKSAVRGRAASAAGRPVYTIHHARGSSDYEVDERHVHGRRATQRTATELLTKSAHEIQRGCGFC
jgi:hypothetical protein